VGEEAKNRAGDLAIRGCEKKRDLISHKRRVILQSLVGIGPGVLRLCRHDWPGSGWKAGKLQRGGGPSTRGETGVPRGKKVVSKKRNGDPLAEEPDESTLRRVHYDLGGGRGISVMEHCGFRMKFVGKEDE